MTADTSPIAEAGDLPAPRPATLHYIHDPLCGWCYAVGPLVDAVQQAGIPIKMHGGGLFPEPVSPQGEKAAYIKKADRRIADLAGVPFGDAYLDGLLDDPRTVFCSDPPIRAIVAAGIINPGKDLEMMRAIQRAHYVEGRRVVDTAVLVDLAEGMGLRSEVFLYVFHGFKVDEHTRPTRRLMDKFRFTGFPSFLLEVGGRQTPLPHESFYGAPSRFLAHLEDLVRRLQDGEASSLPRLGDGA